MCFRPKKVLKKFFKKTRTRWPKSLENFLLVPLPLVFFFLLTRCRSICSGSITSNRAYESLFWFALVSLHIYYISSALEPLFIISYCFCFRLNSGWSFHSSGPARKTSNKGNISVSEQDMIRSVLERSEKVRQVEEERIGYVVILWNNSIYFKVKKFYLCVAREKM